jgi:hypothetical protein
MEQKHMIEINGEKSVTLTAEAYLELEVEYKGKKHLLNGKSDYSAWYEIDKPLAKRHRILGCMLG